MWISVVPGLLKQVSTRQAVSVRAMDSAPSISVLPGFPRAGWYPSGPVR